MKTQASEWITSPLGQVANLVMGQSPESKFYTEEETGLPFLQGCAEFQARFPKHMVFCRQIKKIAPRNSILFSVRAPVGRINIADQPYIIGRGLAAITGTDVEQDYLEQYLCFEEPKFRNVSQGSTFEAINSSELSTWPIEYPTSKLEQSKIAEVLSKVDEAIEQTESLIAKQQRIKAGLMQDLLTRGIDEHGNLRSEETHEFKNSPLGRIPVEWDDGGFEKYVVSDSGIKPGPFGSSITKDMYTTKGARVYGQEQVIGGSLEIGDYFISEAKFREMHPFAVCAGDVLLSLVGTIGHVIVVPKNHMKGIINPRLLRFRPHPDLCIPEFLREILLSEPVRIQLDAFATGGTMPVLSAGIIRSLSIPIVDIEEQRRIALALQAVDKCKNGVIKESAKLRSLKTALMQDLLTGKVRVTALMENIESKS